MKNTLFYREVYGKIIARAKTREPLTGYVEKHHIIPRCMGGSDDADNIVPLTPEEHYVCHQLLVKLHPNHLGLRRAVKMMTYAAPTTRDRAKNKLYGWLRKSIAKPVIITHCLCCNKELKSLESYIKTYCSRKCNCAYRSKKPKKEWKPRITSYCHTCNKEMVVLACLKKKYCSKRCKYDRLYVEKVGKCKQCKNDFIVSKIRKYQVFCSSKCRGESQVKIASKFCLHCNKEFFDAPYKIALKKFCNSVCVSLYRRGKSRVVLERVPITSKPCGHCGKLIYGKPGVLKQQKYCRPICIPRKRVNVLSATTP